MSSLVERHASKISGVMSCFDRVVIQGTLPGLCYAEGMTVFLRQRKVKVFDYARFAEPYREQIRQNAERLAKEHGIADRVHAQDLVPQGRTDRRR